MISSLHPTPSLSDDPAVTRLMRRGQRDQGGAVSRRTPQAAQPVQAPMAPDPQTAQRLMRRQAQEAVANRPQAMTGPLGLPVVTGQKTQVGGWNNVQGGEFGDYVRTPTGERVGRASAVQDPQTGVWSRGRPASPSAPARPQPTAAAAFRPPMAAPAAPDTMLRFGRPGRINGMVASDAIAQAGRSADTATSAAATAQAAGRLLRRPMI